MDSRTARIIDAVLMEALRKRGGVLDVAKIQEFRKDFLTLMKNVNIVADYDKTFQWAKYVGKWVNDFDNYIYKYLLEGLSMDSTVGKDEYKYWDKRIRKPLWDFIVTFRVPFDSDLRYWSKEDQFKRYKQQADKWETKIRRYARIAWDILQEFVEWYEKRFSGKKLFVNEPKIEQLDVGGFSVILKYFVDNSYKPKDAIYVLTLALEIFKDKVPKNAPTLMKMIIPIFADLSERGLDKGAEFKMNKVYLYRFTFTNKPETIARYIAHELGHKLWDDYLSRDDQNLWDKHISGNWGDLDLNEVLRKHGNERDFLYNKEIRESDPILYMQIQGLIQGMENQFHNMFRMVDVKKYLEEGGNPKVKVHTKPISDYAHKNSTEAFCEALSLLAIYGERTLYEDTVSVLREIL